MVQDFYTVSEAASNTGVSEHAIVDLIYQERLPICFRYVGEIVAVTVEPHEDGASASKDIDFDGMVKSLMPPTNEDRLSREILLVSVVRADRMIFSRREGKPKRGIQLPTKTLSVGYILPEYEVHGYLEHASVPRSEWRFYHDDLMLLAAPESQDAYTAPAIPAVSQQQPTATHVNVWDVKDERDPLPKHPWYTPARYFARQFVKADSTLLVKRQTFLPKEVEKALKSARIKGTRGKYLNYTTIVNAFSNVDLS